MDQEPYPNQEDGCTKGLDGSRYQLMDVLRLRLIGITLYTIRDFRTGKGSGRRHEGTGRGTTSNGV